MSKCRLLEMGGVDLVGLKECSLQRFVMVQMERRKCRKKTCKNLLFVYQIGRGRQRRRRMKLEVWQFEVEESCVVELKWRRGGGLGFLEISIIHQKGTLARF